MTKDEKRYPCPCCGFLTLLEGTHETFEICPVCNWEEDDVQFNNPDFRGGANQESLVANLVVNDFPYGELYALFPKLEPET